MPQLSFPIPLRTSSMNAPTGEMLPTHSDQGDPRTRKMHKAQKILGTTDIALDHDYHKYQDKKPSRRPSFLRAPEIKSKKGDGLVLFPPDGHLPSPRLRVRASSPLLGQEYRTAQDPPPPVPEIPKKLHQSGSSSALYSHYARDSPASSNLSFGAVTKDLGLTTDGITERPNPGLNPAFKQPKGPMKDSKRRSRPPRIDLSLLFPKPQTGSAPLLSPQRMMSSPSPISVTSDHSTAKPGKAENRSPARKLTKAPPARIATQHENRHRTPEGPPNLPPSYEIQSPKWFDPSMERTIRTSEMDIALERDSDMLATPRSTDRIRYSLLNFRPRSREQLSKSDTKSIKSVKSGKSTQSSQSTLRKIPSNPSVRASGKETYLSPKSHCGSNSNNLAASARQFQFSSHDHSSIDKSSNISKKSSRSTLKNSNLHNSSVLCLSSSEDEDDEPVIPRTKHKDVKNPRDSVGTFGEFEAEICTASAAQATRGTLKNVQRPTSTSTRESRKDPRSLNLKRDSSAPLAGISSPATKGTQSRRSSGVPAILEPDFFHNDPIFSQMRKSTISTTSTISQKEYNRRSRVMAVTRQEEHLLEVMRQRQGKITPSVFHEARYSGAQEADRRSVISGPSRDSFYCSDTSFLRLSPGIPPPGLSGAIQGANHIDKGASMSRGTVSDAEQRTMISMASPRGSLISSGSLPSPATSGASPLTPTLPIHRFSPLPSKPPPRRPPPPVPEIQKQHSRRRTDSSEAIVLSGSGTPKESNELPIWALGWNGDASNVTAVH